MVFKDFCVLVLLGNVASALEGLRLLPSLTAYIQGLTLRFQAKGPNRSFDEN